MPGESVYVQETVTVNNKHHMSMSLSTSLAIHKLDFNILPICEIKEVYLKDYLVNYNGLANGTTLSKHCKMDK